MRMGGKYETGKMMKYTPRGNLRSNPHLFQEKSTSKYIARKMIREKMRGEGEVVKEA